MRKAIPLIGQAYKHRQLELSSQTCKNYWPEINTETNTIVSLQSWPGYELVSSLAGEDGGSYTFKNVLYRIIGNSLYSISSLGESTSYGSVLGSGRCYFYDNGTQLIIVRGNNYYIFDGSSVVRGSDVDLGSPKNVTGLNNQAIYGFDDRGFAVSQPADLGNIDGLDFASKESSGDKLIRPFAFNGELYLIGESTTERWWNSGQGSPPFDRIQGGIIEQGTISPHSVASNSQFLYMLGSDYRVYRLVGGQAQKISTIPISQEFKTYTSISDAIGACFAIDGQEFYYLKFPSGGKSWGYCEESNGWFELTTTNRSTPYKATSFAEAYGDLYIGINGNTYKINSSVCMNGDEVVLRERISPVISGRLFDPSLEGRWVEMADLVLTVRVSPVLSGQGSIPTIMFSYSDDAGRTWSNERHLKGRQLGQYIYEIKTEQLGQFRERVIRVRISDPIVSSIQSATADLRLGM